MGKKSLYNTPPAFPIYMVGKTLKWIKKGGGLAAMEKINREKGDLLYGVMDKHPGFFRAPVEKDSRSYMNVVFRLPTEELEQQFIAEGKEAGHDRAQGPPLRGRLPRLDLQRHPAFVGQGRGRDDGGVRAQAGVAR